MNYVEAYIYEVGQNLPEKMRADIQNEIRTLIEDTLEDESRAAGRPADEAMTLDVLRKLGAPDKMAASYLPPRYLIGPTLYPTFIMVMRIVATVMIILAAVGLGIALGVGDNLPSEVFSILGESALELLSSVVSAIGSVVVIFAIIERVAPNARMDEEAWDPRKLKEAAGSERVSPADPIASIIFSALFLMVLFLSPEWLGISTVRDGAWVHVPLLTPAFFQFARWFSVLIALEIIQNALLLGSGRWTRGIRWLAIAIAVMTIVLGIEMLSGPALVSLDAAGLAQLGWGDPDAGSIERLSEGLKTLARVVIGIVIAFELIEIGKQVYRLTRGNLPQPTV